MTLQIGKKRGEAVKQFSSCNIFSPPTKIKNDEVALDEKVNKASKMDEAVRTDLAPYEGNTDNFESNFNQIFVRFNHIFSCNF